MEQTTWLGICFVLLEISYTFSSMITTCPSDASQYFIADHYDRCRYYRCRNGEVINNGAQTTFRCAQGSGTKPGYHGYSNPCTQKYFHCYLKNTYYSSPDPYGIPPPQDYTYDISIHVPAPVPTPAPAPSHAMYPEPVTPSYSDKDSDHQLQYAYQMPDYHDNYQYYDHQHQVPDHYHQLPDHQHQVPDHYHQLPDHQHEVPDHYHQLPDHHHQTPDYYEQMPDGNDGTGYYPPYYPEEHTLPPEHHHLALGYVHPYPEMVYYTDYSYEEHRKLQKVIYKLQGMHVPGGTLMKGINDLHYCLHACAKNTTCHGFDFNSVDRTCWFHTTTTVCDPPVAKSDCTNFKFDPCPSTTTSSVTTSMPVTGGMNCFQNMNIVGGLVQPTTLNTQALCQAACMADPACVGFDFASTSNTCWFHTASTECSMMMASTGTTHCRFITCTTGTMTLIPFPNMQAIGGTLQMGITTAVQCITQCMTMGTAVCVAVDFDTSSNTCWFHTTATCNARQAKPQCINIQIAACP